MSADPSARDVADRDELLQLLYWLEGEGLGSETTCERMSRFLTWPEARLRATLSRLERHGEVEASGPGFHLTPSGRREAARRFAEEFSPLLSQGHGECNDPDCECKRSGPAACHR